MGKTQTKKNSERRVAIIFHHYPPRNDRIACAAGLDSFESIKLLIDEMKQKGYEIEKTFENGDALAKEVLNRMTCDQRFLLPEQMAERTEAKAGEKDYKPWHDALPKGIKEKMTSDWGKIPGELFVHDKEMLFAGFLNGNVFISVQPPRGYLENIEKAYHDMYLSPPHHYLAQYRYIKNIFKADAVIHVGKHGSLEWLPGKALGLSESCHPDLSIMDLPNIYPYIINDPGEGTQAKRRSYCCIIDHLTPVFTNADLYEELSKLENLLKEYQDANNEDPGKIDVLKSMIWEAVTETDLDKDLELDEQTVMNQFEEFLEKLHSYLSELSDTMIGDGLHIMGQAPKNERMVEFLVQLTRVPNGNIPSLRESIVKAMGYDYDQLLAKRGQIVSENQKQTGGDVIKKAHQTALNIVSDLMKKDLQKISVSEIITSQLDQSSDDIKTVLRYITDILMPKINQTTQEISSSFDALSGEFVKPGPSGAPTRGQADILPTGRNFYSVDPNKIPSQGAWEVGVRLGDALIERYLSETGNYPESIGIIVYGTATMRSKGDDIAEILYLLGVKPVWHKSNGTVLGLEIIPADELKRPRLDVVPRISGFSEILFLYW
ncbi:MAG: hypothetical protein OMM_02491 [Candidatus Magnetoglobus multicellularis str. Araruama]|uniref:CobN/magnesium chelatase domain-containing protein n=1 Tax=Candidatus Magnetoglobus multicellularis str. Araruama TaxID=890399 RepID=A0A1V1P9F8_9BACT|nr:MAG: hypothetical protein OMM_02491 [Candidatus Magnetoglobus multicellularis str. Araruama]